MKENVRIQANAMKGINDISMKGEIVVFGSTYMSGFPLYELVNKCMFENAVYNRSIAGLTVREAREIVKDCVIDIRPSKVFLALGEEDEQNADATEEYRKLVYDIAEALPECEIYLIGITGIGQYAYEFNRSIRNICDGKRIKYIDLISKQVPDTALYKARFKQLSRFFRDQSMNIADAFAIAEI